MRKLSLEACQQRAQQRGGRCLATTYKNTKTPMQWECAKHHKWRTTFQGIRRGSWCLHCARQAKPALAELQAFATNKKGLLLSSKYVNSSTKLLWQCENHHQWRANWHNIKDAGSWCPHCQKRITEQLARAYCEHYTGVPFPTARPHWLRNDAGERLELDGYATILRVAFEYQGVQHYKEIPFFRAHTLTERQRNDATKRRQCRAHNVMLITIPYTITKERLGTYILEQLHKHRVPVTNRTVPAPEDLALTIPTRLEQCEQLAQQRGGRCLATQYLSARTKLLWECGNHHQWRASPHEIKQGTWCPTCARERRGDQKRTPLAQLQAYAAHQGGACLETRYTNNATYLLWRCKNGHVWSATWNKVKDRKLWCQQCRNHRNNHKTGDTT